MSENRHITILGDGAWGTALALQLHSKGHKICMWGAFPEYIEQLRQQRENALYLPGVKIPAEIKLTSSIPEAMEWGQIVITAVPSHVLREVCLKISAICARHARDKFFVNVAKGIESSSLMRMSEIIIQTLSPLGFCALSGPSHAEEVARRIPTTVVLASEDEQLCADLQQVLSTNSLRIYTSTDVVGVETGGACKNVVAIATGICDGLSLGDNTKAAIITRGLHEILRLGLTMNAQQPTFSGLSGLGDLVVTCMSRHSRNRWFGEQIGLGKNVPGILSSTKKAVEGYHTALSLKKLCDKLGVEMPICNQVHAVVYENKNPLDAVSELMGRSLKSEQMV